MTGRAHLSGRSVKVSSGFEVDVCPEEAAIEKVRAAVMAHFADAGLSERMANRLEVILEELVSNVVRHAAGVDTIRVTAGQDAAGVAITVEDDGAPFNPLEAPEPGPFGNVEDVALGGRGIQLVRRLSTTFRYDRTDTRNRVEVTLPLA